MTDLSGVRLISLHTNADGRGSLTAIEGTIDVPFEIRRIFYVHDVQSGHERGGHAHPHTEQLLIGLGGGLSVDVCSPSAKQTYRLDDPSQGLYVPEMLWVRLYDFTPGGVCLAAASTHYANGEVIRDWDEYVRMARG